MLGLVDLGHIAARERVRGIVDDRELELPPALDDVAAIGRRQREPDARQRGFGLQCDGLLERRLRGAGVAAAELREPEHDERCGGLRRQSARASRVLDGRARIAARERELGALRQCDPVIGLERQRAADRLVGAYKLVCRLLDA